MLTGSPYGLISILNHSQKLRSWFLKPHAYVTSMYMPLWFCQFTRLNMVGAAAYFRLWTIQTKRLTSTGNLLLLVLVISAQLNSAMRRPWKEHGPFTMHAFHKFSQLLFEKSGITVHSNHKPLEKFSSAPWPLPQATCKAWCSLFSAIHSLLNIDRIFRLHCLQPSSCTNFRKK